MVVGIFGGSFNPIHTGHAMVASFAAGSGVLDEVWLMVSPQNPLKADRKQAPEADRLAMAELVARRCKGVKACDFEFSLPRPSYTYDTLKALRERYPEHQFRLIIGSDNLRIFSRWRNADKIRKEFGIVVYPRPDYPVEESLLLENVSLLDECPQVLVSSTFIRDRITAGEPVAFLVTEEVEAYIAEHGLYAEESE